MWFSSESLCELHLLEYQCTEIWGWNGLRERNGSFLILSASQQRKCTCHFAEGQITALTFLHVPWWGTTRQSRGYSSAWPGKAAELWCWVMFSVCHALFQAAKAEGSREQGWRDGSEVVVVVELFSQNVGTARPGFCWRCCVWMKSCCCTETPEQYFAFLEAFNTSLVSTVLVLG